MGGSGSGNRWRYGTRSTCEASLRIDLRYMRKRGLLQVGRSGSLSWSRGGEQIASIRYTVNSHSLELDYRTRSPGEEEWICVREHVPLYRREQPFGGSRVYLGCLRCHRKSLVLYGGTRFRCRKCLNLAYASQGEDIFGRATTRSRLIRMRLGGEGCFDDPFPPKPKGMHWSTYQRLESECARLDDLAAVELCGLIARFGGVGRN